MVLFLTGRSGERFPLAVLHSVNGALMPLPGFSYFGVLRFWAGRPDMRLWSFDDPFLVARFCLRLRSFHS